MAGNRVVNLKRGRDFSDYVIEKDNWVSPALIVNLPKGEARFEAAQEFDNGTAWGVIEVDASVLHGVEICDGQHRTLGIFLALESVEAAIRDKRERIEEARANGNDDVVPVLEGALSRWLAKREQLGREHIAIDLAEVSQPERQEMFVDIADNAKGIPKDLTTTLDQREAVNRISIDLIEHHPLLEGRVASGREGRWGAKNPNLLGAKNVADIVRALNVGVIGRVGKKVDQELAAREAEVTEQAMLFIDTLVLAFPDLKSVEEAVMTPLELRAKSMLGSATMLRVLAAVYKELSNPKDEEPMTRSQIGSFFSTVLGPHMDEIPVVQSNKFWMASGAFIPDTKAPQARQGSLKSLVRYLVKAARQ
jgi:hypothetical protein